VNLYEINERLKSLYKILTEKQIDLGFKKPATVSYHTNLLFLLNKGLRDEKGICFKNIHPSEQGIEGILLFKQPDGKVGRYQLTLRKVGLK
jgi:hypothetical protein